ncbi:MAG: hypothetical protein EXS05_19540 [Planctomycetaceae bacterium]|nr:hypothetical protein [Planctomycetaceae bacterium]
MQVDLSHGKCRSCGGVLEITEVDDATMTVECQDGCGESYLVETDAFNDGGLMYWPAMMARQEEQE